MTGADTETVQTLLLECQTVNANDGTSLFVFTFSTSIVLSVHTEEGVVTCQKAHSCHCWVRCNERVANKSTKAEVVTAVWWPKACLNQKQYAHWLQLSSASRKMMQEKNPSWWNFRFYISSYLLFQYALSWKYSELLGRTIVFCFYASWYLACIGKRFSLYPLHTPPEPPPWNSRSYSTFVVQNVPFSDFNLLLNKWKLICTTLKKLCTGINFRVGAIWMKV